MSELRNNLLPLPGPTNVEEAWAPRALLARRRSIRRLRDRPFDEAILGRVPEAVPLTTAAYGRPAWRLVSILPIGYADEPVSDRNRRALASLIGRGEPWSAADGQR